MLAFAARARSASATGCSTRRSGCFADFLYTIPSLALFQLLVPFTGLTVTTVEIALVSYTLLILYRNMSQGCAPCRADVLEAARGMGLTRAQTFMRVELPLALPAIMAGLRIATVSTISIATVAALVIPKGLGRPIFIALQAGHLQDRDPRRRRARGRARARSPTRCSCSRSALLTPWTRAA